MVEDLPAGGHKQTGQDSQDCRLAAAGRTQERNHLIGPDLKPDVVEHAEGNPVGLVKLLRHVLQLAQRGGETIGRRGGIHLLKEKRASAKSLQRFQTNRLKATTTADITTTLAASKGNRPAAAAWLICAPRP